MGRRRIVSHVLDTCAVLDLVCGKWTNKSAREALRTAEDPVIPSIVVWEISRKVRKEKLTLPCELSEIPSFIEEVCLRYDLRVLPLSMEDCHRAELLPPIHGDPMDRMILATAWNSNCPVFTTDRRFSEYPVQVISQK